ncbi:hypothetical protein MJO28_016963 [Puccinia striiformis f. sp. tritici]|uniref:Dynein heavy chain C-terminal domain-containing protein n=1 Tax=Puccinia striiformis TaxID=27350 RepID=A0A2S4WIR2_9BASI|nr:hypothetical protein MJO28_016963 [Puccinia striiformis f. sp. tritici]POW21680.1 hypothetical protein PSHT_02143 [Puccinia striiformis]
MKLILLSHLLNGSQILIIESDNLKDSIRLGLLFFPDGFLTATRQFVSCQTRISLEVLKLQLFIDYQASVSDEIQVNGFKLQGLIIQGGCLKESRLEFNEGGDYLPNGTILQYIQTNQRRKDNQ